MNRRYLSTHCTVACSRSLCLEEARSLSHTIKSQFIWHALLVKSGIIGRSIIPSDTPPLDGCLCLRTDKELLTLRLRVSVQAPGKYFKRISLFEWYPQLNIVDL